MVSGRRINVLSRNIAELLPDTVSQGLDIGCGDGAISNLLMSFKPELKISGVDVLVREKTFVPVTRFDGIKLPFDDKSFDFCMLIDVLHHTDFQMELLKESFRVASKFVIIKDHYCQNHYFAIYGLGG
jgi:ubiquinone/menaquinone biosynthesis C-methylase UbiE